MFQTTRYLIIAGYSTVILWSLWVLYTNHLNATRRTIARLALVTGTVWVVVEVAIGFISAADLWLSLAHIPTIAVLLIVIQTVQATQDDR